MLLKSGQELPKISFLEYFNFIEIDKVIHIGIFVILSFLYKLAFPRISFLLFFIITFIYSGLTEILQGCMDMGRSMELYDLIADLLGLTIGYFIAKIFINIFTTSKK